MGRAIPQRGACTCLRPAALLALLAVLWLGGCAPGDEGDTAAEPLRLAYLPGEEDPEGRMVAFSGLADYLSKHMGRQVELIQAVSYAPTIEAMRASKIDFMRAGGPFTYMIAHEKAGAEAVVHVGTSAGPGLYQSAIVAWPGSGIESLQDLVSHAAEIDFAFVDPASTSGHLVPRARLETLGIDPDDAFGRTIFTMSHTNSAMTIVSGKVQAGAISFNTYTRLVERGLIEADDMTILWKSEPIPTGPVMVRADLPEEIKDRLRQAYLDLNDSGEPVFEAMKQVYRTDDLRFYPAMDADFDGLRAIARNVDSFDMLPGG
ncbi:MAG: phosphate/phosphite/phosphonate ABC transporter substrate-binding protein [Pseudomonadales bacterium]|jgi:phosphonate transport system substrate-binding protein|nr:phosphate/phosphite/phosphonate ABC transporter substrate-binding protein [Pseudomonadales bacterium]